MSHSERREKDGGEEKERLEVERETYCATELHVRGFDYRLRCHLLRTLVILYMTGSIFDTGCMRLLPRLLFVPGNAE